LGVRGWVRNLADGRVEAVFEGTEKNVAELVERCSKGPRAAYVENIEVMDVKDESEFDEFRVRL
jgi:acylphosphatase